MGIDRSGVVSSRIAREENAVSIAAKTSPS